MATNVQAALVELDGEISPLTTAVPNKMNAAGGSTDRAIVKFNGTVGKSVLNSGVIISDANAITGVASLVANDIGANTVSAYTAPTNPDHLTRKDYVDSKVGGGGSQEVYTQAAEPGAGVVPVVWVDIDDTSVEASPVWRSWTGTQAAYDAIGTKDPGTLYAVVG